MTIAPDQSKAEFPFHGLQHLADGVTKGGADAVLAASIFHFAEYTIPEAKRFMAEQGIEVRQL